MVYNESEQRSNIAVGFQGLAEKVKAELEKEIQLHKNGKGTVGHLPQLEKAYKEVELMVQARSEDKFSPGYPRMIVDSWEYGTKLGDLLLELKRLYEKL